MNQSKKTVDKTMSVLFIVAGNKNKSEQRLAKEICVENKANMVLFEKLKNIFCTLERIRKHQTVIFHQPALRSALLIMISKLIKKQTVCLIWDSYPVIIAGRRYDNRLVRVIADCLENFLLSIVDVKIVPTADFLERYPDAKKKYFWPKIKLSNSKRISRIQKGEKVRVLFAGQINETRGLLESYYEMSLKFEMQFELVICSGDRPCDDLLNKANVDYLGVVDLKELPSLIETCHFGLVSLNSFFSGPALPSKTYEYLKQGMTIIYSGPLLKTYVNALEVSGVGIILNHHKKITREYLENYLSCDKSKKRIYESIMKINDEKEIGYL